VTGALDAALWTALPVFATMDEKEDTPARVWMGVDVNGVLATEVATA